MYQELLHQLHISHQRGKASPQQCVATGLNTVKAVCIPTGLYDILKMPNQVQHGFATYYT